MSTGRGAPRELSPKEAFASIASASDIRVNHPRRENARFLYQQVQQKSCVEIASFARLMRTHRLCAVLVLLAGIASTTSELQRDVQELAAAESLVQVGAGAGKISIDVDSDDIKDEGDVKKGEPPACRASAPRPAAAHRLPSPRRISLQVMTRSQVSSSATWARRSLLRRRRSARRPAIPVSLTCAYLLRAIPTQWRRP